MRRGMRWASLVAVLFVAGYVLYTDDEARLRKEWRQLLEHGRKDPGASLISAAHTARSIQGYFTSNAIIEVGGPYPATISRADWPALISRAWHLAEQIEVYDRGHDLTLNKEDGTARLEVALEVQARVAGEESRQVEGYQLDWRKEGGTWRIHRVTRLETIRNPSSTPIQ